MTNGPMTGKDKVVRDQPVEMPAEQGPLAPYHGEQPPAPQWFQDAIAAPYRTAFTECEGAKIHYQSWGDPAKPGLLLVHGNGAHAHWWDFVAPYLTDDYHVVAMTFSGMGDSQWRETYAMGTFAKEQLAVCEAAGLFAHAEKPIIVSHSFGGFVTILTDAEYGERFTGIVIVDSPENPPDRPRRGPPGNVRGNKVYPTPGEGLCALPPRPAPALREPLHPRLHRPLVVFARAAGRQRRWLGVGSSIRSGSASPPSREPRELLKETRCRIALFKGDKSVIWEDDVGDYMRGLLNRQVPFVVIPEARHHVMLDQPLAFVAALRTLLQEWQHSTSDRAIPTA